MSASNTRRPGLGATEVIVPPNAHFLVLRLARGQRKLGTCVRSLRRLACYLFLTTAALKWTFHALAQPVQGPQITGAQSSDGTTILICFSEPVVESSATNIANYSLDDSNTTISAASLLPDQQSGLLFLSRPLSQPFYLISWTNLLGTNGSMGFGGPRPGSAVCLEFTNIGTPGIDPLHPGSPHSCEGAIVGGSGIGGTNDGCYFVYREWVGDVFSISTAVQSLEPVNRFSRIALMVRESLDPGSRFYCVAVTPPDVPCADGSGNGADEYQALYREVTNGPVKEWPGGGRVKGVGYSDTTLELARNPDFIVADYRIGRGSYQQLAFAFLTNFPAKVFVGVAVTSSNNDAGFATTARLGRIRLWPVESSGNEPVHIERSNQNVNVLWPSRSGFILQSSTHLDAGALWNAVTNDSVVLSNAYQSITLEVGANLQFFRLKDGIFQCLQN